MTPIVVFTIGHSTRPIKEFTRLLKAHGVQRVIDVRTIPAPRLTAGSRSFCWCLPRVAGDCRSEPYSNEVNKLPPCRIAPEVAASCRELWREKGKKKAK